MKETTIRKVACDFLDKYPYLDESRGFKMRMQDDLIELLKKVALSSSYKGMSVGYDAGCNDIKFRRDSKLL